MRPGRTSKWLALVCLVAVLLAALLPATSGIFFTALLAPLWLFLAPALLFAPEFRDDDPTGQPSSFLSIVAARAPPVC